MDQTSGLPPSASLFTVPPDGGGRRLDLFLKSLFPDFSRSVLQGRIRRGEVRVAGAAAKPGRVLRAGETVEVFPPAPEGPTIPPDPIPLDVLFEDADLIVLDKPPGLAVHPARSHRRGTLVNALAHRFASLSDLNGPLRPGIVHRLDKGTSGILVAAKTNLAHAALADQFAKRTVEKEYWAVVEGEVEGEGGPLAGFVARDLRRRSRMKLLSEPGRGRAAELTFKVLERFRRFTLVRARPKTGRTHQIRLQLKGAGHAVVCDSTYGFRSVLTLADIDPGAPGGDRILLSRMALHARRLCFAHPRTGERMAFEAPLPADFAGLVEALRAAPPDLISIVRDHMKPRRVALVPDAAAPFENVFGALAAARAGGAARVLIPGLRVVGALPDHDPEKAGMRAAARDFAEGRLETRERKPLFHRPSVQLPLRGATPSRIRRPGSVSKRRQWDRQTLSHFYRGFEGESRRLIQARFGRDIFEECRTAEEKAPAGRPEIVGCGVPWNPCLDGEGFAFVED